LGRHVFGVLCLTVIVSTGETMAAQRKLFAVPTSFKYRDLRLSTVAALYQRRLISDSAAVDRRYRRNAKRRACPTIRRLRRPRPLPRSPLRSRAASVSKPTDAGIRRADKLETGPPASIRNSRR